MKRVLIAAAGTGGHVFPALAVAKRLQAQGWQVDWVGSDEGRLESTVVPAHNIPLHAIVMQGIRGHGALRLLKAPFVLLAAIRQCRRLIKTLAPEVVLTFGGYVCAPLGMAARSQRIPLLVHEQNAVAGMTTRLLAPMASKVMLGLPLAKKSIDRAECVGNPLREEIEQLAKRLAQQEKRQQQRVKPLQLLVVGGSLGARVLNEVVPLAVNEITLPITVRHQCGTGNRSEVEQRYREVSEHHVVVSDFIDDMAAAYEAADLIICRAGALTVSELAALGKPALFVPLPHAVDDHQTENAKVLVSAGAAVLLQQSELTPSRLATQLQSLLQQPQQLWTMARFARDTARPHATDKVTQICIDVATKTAAEQVK